MACSNDSFGSRSGGRMYDFILFVEGFDRFVKELIKHHSECGMYICRGRAHTCSDNSSHEYSICEVHMHDRVIGGSLTVLQLSYSCATLTSKLFVIEMARAGVAAQIG